MAEKKKGLSIGMIITSIAVGAAAGVFYYYRKAEIKKIADEIIARVKPTAGADGAGEEPGDWDIRSCAETESADAAEVNIVDSGVSLESVEMPESGAEAGAEAESESAEEAGPEAEAEEPEEDEDDIERPKKPWFWSK